LIKNTGLDPHLIPALNTEIQQIARSFALPYLDLHTELSDAQGQLLPTCTEDGLHLNGQGYLVWKKQLDKILLGT
jgi:lysophospholipase L1-like esterase